MDATRTKYNLGTQFECAENNVMCEVQLNQIHIIRLFFSTIIGLYKH